MIRLPRWLTSLYGDDRVAREALTRAESRAAVDEIHHAEAEALATNLRRIRQENGFAEMVTAAFELKRGKEA